jgi:hypothetical protein
MIQKMEFLEFNSKKTKFHNKEWIPSKIYSQMTMEIATKVYLLPEFKKTDYF